MKAYIPNPTIIEDTGRGEKHYDIYSRLLKDRIVFLGTEINSTVSNLIIAQILFLEQDNPDAPIKLYINSPGGSVYAGLGIYDIMNLVKCPVETVCVGLAASMASVLLAAGDKRRSLPNSRIMIHQPLGGVSGQCSDIQIAAEEIQKIKNTLNDIYAKHGKKTSKEFAKLTDRDNYLTPKEAIKLGLIDNIVG